MAWGRSDSGGLRERRPTPPSYYDYLSPRSSFSSLTRSSQNLRLPRWRVLNLFRWRFIKMAVAFFACAALLRFFVGPFRKPELPRVGPYLTDSRVLDADAIEPGSQKLVIILPIDKPLHDLCKVVSSAVALGYPPPVLVNWRKEFNTGKAGIGPSHLAKVSGTLDFLEWATHNDTDDADRLDDDDLVVMLDALDIWFQLPPSVLLHRYYSIIQAASERVVSESGFSDPSWMRQKTIAAAQKGCMGPRDPVSNLHCDQLPESILPNDVYGVLTDSYLMDANWKWRRPRYLNSGSFMGPAGDMKKYFTRVKEKLDKVEKMGIELGGDQGVFSEVFGEQETWRREVQAAHRARDSAAERKKAQERNEWDFGLTIDYTQELFYPTGYSENDGGFLVLEDEDVDLRSTSATSDFDEAKSPLADLEGVPAENLSLGHMSLYVDYWTGAVPAVLHHNAWRNGLKERRKTWWDKMWYFPYLRRLVTAHSDAKQKMVPLASLPASKGKLEVWPYGAEKKNSKKSSFILETKEEKDKKKKKTTLRPAEWEEICKLDKDEAEEKMRWYDEVFRDEGGPLKAKGG